MLKSWMHDIALAVQARSGLTAGLVVGFAIIALAGFTAFAFLCVAAYGWLSLQTSSVVAGLIMAGLFALIAMISIIVCALARRRARERAILERAARAHAPSWLLDPRILAAAVQIGREIGWQRIVPVAVMGFMAAQWAREHREQSRGSGD
jgi:predicted RND superfamily exporter protein